MILNIALLQTRAQASTQLKLQQKLLRALLPLTFGLFMGFIAKQTEHMPLVFEEAQDVFNILGNIGTRLGIWVLIATLISAWSRSPRAAAVHVFLFFAGMLAAYYLYSMVIFGFFPTYYFLRWGAIALFSPLCAYIVWYARGSGWFAAFSASLPIGLLLATGYRFYRTFSIEQGFDLCSAILLFAILPAALKYQRLKLIPFIFAVSFVIDRFRILNFIFSGL